jgi:serine/threonine protein kinase
VSSERLQHIQALYNDAASLAPPDRAAFLDDACGGDMDLRKEIESLLAYQHEAETYLDKPAFEVAARSLANEGAGTLADRKLGRYQLLSLVGRGGMGEVYCAVDSRLNRLVAVKTLPSYMASDPQHVERFEQEARAIAVLNHPHICILHDAGYDDGLHYLVFEYLVGELLSDHLCRGHSLAQAMEYATQIADALAYAHDLGIIHLDLKPSNIMLMKSGVKLLDFGVAELRDPMESASNEAPKSKGEPRKRKPGTPGYMAPEQLEGNETDARTDVFAFGAVLYEILTQSRAFPNQPQTASALGDGPPSSIRKSRPEVPTSLDTLVTRCLALEPADRWQSMSDVLSQCEAIRAALRET